MKTIILTLTLLFFQSLSAQTLIEIGLHDKSNIVLKKPIKINLKNSELEIREFLNYLGIKKVKFDEKDITAIKKLIEKAKVTEPNFENWTETELPNKILIQKEEYLNVKKGLEKIPWVTKADKKRIKKEIRKYNNRDTEWRSFPLAMSRPIYSTDKKFAIISFIKGNNGGNVSLFKNLDGNWTFVEYIMNWAY